MSDSLRYYEEQDLSKKEVTTSNSEKVLNFVNLFRLLSATEKLELRRIINQEKIF